MAFAGEISCAAPALVSTRMAPAQKVRVLLIAPFAARGGGMGRIMAYLAAQGAEGICFEMVESRGGGPAMLSPWYLLKAAARIVTVALSAGPAVVHVNMAERSSIVRKGLLLTLARACGLPTLLHLHAAEIVPFYQRLPRLARAVLRAMFRRAGMCVVLGEPWRAWLCGEVGVDPARITVLRNGVAVPASRRAAASEAGFTFLFLGNLLARKGLPDLLHAIAAPRFHFIAWHLMVAGGGNIVPLRLLAQRLGIEHRVTFCGWLDRAATDAALLSADALVLPSHHEALPLVLLEAASVGVPVITTPVGAIAELFRHDETALLVPPGDRDALADALHRVLTEPECRARLARNGRALYAREFAIAPFADALRCLYFRLAAVAIPE